MNNAVASAARELLSRKETKVALVGPKPAQERALTKIMRAVTVASVFGFAGMAATVALIPTGLFQEVIAHSTQAEKIESAPEYLHWIKMPTSPFMEAGRLPDGGLSTTLMLTKWQLAGLSPDQARLALETVERLSPVLLGRVDPQLESEMMADAAAASAQLETSFPEVAENLRLGRNARRSAILKHSWDEEQTRLVSIVAEFGGHTPLSWKDFPARADTKPTLKQARKSLEQAVQVSGLRSLRLPLSYTSPVDMTRAARHIELANQELQKATGWSGQVLGLGGRVEMAIGSPDSRRNAMGVTMADDSGRLQVTGEWETLGHEWFHALDRVLGRLALKASSGASLSMSVQPLRQPSDRPVWEAMRTMEEAMFKVAPQWQAARAKMAEETDSFYWVSANEGLAFAFGAHLQRTGAIALGSPQTFARFEFTEPARIPSAEESAKQAPLFDALFKATASLELSNPEKAPTLASWRSSRANAPATADASRRSPILR